MQGRNGFQAPLEQHVPEENLNQDQDSKQGGKGSQFLQELAPLISVEAVLVFLSLVVEGNL